MIKTTIVGTTGYTGRELIHYLLRHPEAEIVHCTSESSAGKPVSTIHSYLAGKSDLKTEKCHVDSIARDSDLAFLCLPHGHSAKIAKELLERKVKVIDLSADFRFKSASTYEKWYGIKHPFPDLLKKAVYGLPEIHREEIVRADLIANPGCYATATILSTLPLVGKNLVEEDSIIVDAKSGVSGAGKKMESRYLFCETNENFLAYAVACHRHGPEIEQELSGTGKPKSEVRITFVPHLLPVNRGILVTVYASLKKKVSVASLREWYVEFYKDEPFVVILPEGSFPEIRSVQNSNFCHIGVQVDERNNRAIIVGVIDNLGKGASSQAIQNMNLRFGLDEKTGLL